MNRFVVILLLVSHIQHAPSQKCCDADSYLRRNNSVYFCDKDEDKRLQIFSKRTNLLRNATEGACFDVNRTVIAEFKFRNHDIFEEKAVDVNFYRKCCPLGHTYNSVAHSCVWTENVDESFVTQNFVKVGLPHCRVIVDYPLTPGSYRLELGNLYIDEYPRFSEDEYCIDKNEANALIARGCFENLSVCNDSVRCVHKCCPDGQSFVNGQKCLNTYVHGVNLSFSDRINNSQDPFVIIHRYNCRIYILREKIQFYLDTDGRFYAFENRTNSFLRFEVEDKSYCIEHVLKGKLNGFQFFMCFPDNAIASKFLVARWAKILSIIFICITIGVYIFLPEMLNLFGKILLNYCLSMLSIFALLIYVQFDRTLSDESCVAASFLVTYMSLSSFSWLNVMCFNIWRTFGIPKSVIIATQKRSNWKKLFFYSLYGWGLPVVVTLIVYMAYGVFDTPYVIRPLLGSYKCFWEKRSGNYGVFLYYVTPLILMEVANIAFFLKTVFYYMKVKQEIQMMDSRLSMKERRKSYNIDKEQLFLILKLGVIMGISFAFEVISSLFTFGDNPVLKYVEIVWDTINCLQGVFIFFIFIVKKNVFLMCRNRIKPTKERQNSESTTLTSVTPKPKSKITSL